MDGDVLAGGGDLLHPGPEEGALLVERALGEQGAEPVDVGAHVCLGELDRLRLGDTGLEVGDVGLEPVGGGLERVDALGEHARVDGAEGERVDEPGEPLALLVEQAALGGAGLDQLPGRVAEAGVHLVEQGAEVGDREHVGFLDAGAMDEGGVDPEEAEWQALIAAWGEAHGAVRVRASDLLRLGRSLDLGIAAPDRTEHATRARFGRGLGARRQRVYGAWRMCDGFDPGRKQRVYWLAEAAVKAA